MPGALPVGRNSPQRAPYGLYAELISGTAFTAARHENRRTWTYRIRPSVVHKPYTRIDNVAMRTAPFNDTEATPSQLRWSPFPIPEAPTEFVEGIVTIGGSGNAAEQTGMAVHVYAANRSMTDRYFYNADGEMLIVPQQGRVRFVTELGVLEVANGEIALIPRGLRFRVELPDGPSRGYICENYGQMFRLPELGPLGSNGLANPRDFLAPVAAYETKETPCLLVAKFQGNLWAAEMAHSPLSVVAWHGNFVALQVRPVALHGDRHHQLRPSRSVDLQRAHRAVGHSRHRQHRLRDLSRRAGWSARTPSGRPGSTAT